jgi:acyl carrier protein
MSVDTNADVQEIRDHVDRVIAARRDELFGVVRDSVASVMNIEAGRVTPQAVLEELGAESLDTLDLVFRLESAYRIKIPRSGIRQAAQSGLGEAFEKKGVITEAGLERLRILMPEVDQSRLREGLAARDLPGLFTVETFVRLVAGQLPAGEPARV